MLANIIMNTDKNSIIYSLTIEDIQTVAGQELGRKLSPKEIEDIKESIAEKITWFDAISDSISEKFVWTK
jgi:hypothetical protein